MVTEKDVNDAFETRFDGVDTFDVVQELLETESQLTALQEQHRWIPVAERLPEDKVLVLLSFPPTYITNNSVMMVRWDSIDHRGYVFTHWMPIPQLPKDSEDGKE